MKPNVSGQNIDDKKLRLWLVLFGWDFVLSKINTTDKKLQRVDTDVLIGIEIYKYVHHKPQRNSMREF